MKYYRFSCSNGWCGCDEDFYEAVEDDADLDEIGEEILFNLYSFAEPDGRFIGDKSFGDEITDEEYEEYQQDLCVDWEEISEEEYKEHMEE